MEEKELKAKDIPGGYALCFNDACSLKDKCMHYQARLMKSDGRDIGQSFLCAKINHFDEMSKY